MKYFAWFLVFVLFLSCSKNKGAVGVDKQYTEIDKLLNLAKDQNYLEEDRLAFTDSALLKIKIQKNDSINRRNYFKVANRYYELMDYKKYFSVSKKVLELSKQKRDTLNIARANEYLGDYFFEIAKIDSAYIYYTNAAKNYALIRDELSVANLTLLKANVLLYSKDYVGSEETSITALKIAKKHGDNVLQYRCYINLGASLLGLLNFDKALEYNYKALEKCEDFKDNYLYAAFTAQAYNYIGIVYLKSNKYAEARNTFEKGLKIEEILSTQPVLYASMLDYYAYSKFKLNDNSLPNDLVKALKIREELENKSGIIMSKLHLAEFYAKNKNVTKAIEYIDDAYLKAKEAGYHGDVLDCLDLAIKIDSTKALKRSLEYIKLSDSLYVAERDFRNKFSRIEFETDAILEKNELLSERQKITIIVSIIVISFSILLYLILYLRSKQKELIFSQEQQRANEEIYKLMLDQEIKLDTARNAEKNRIAKDLHDGIMNRLTSTRLNLFVLSKRRDDETIQNCINYINDIQNIEKEVRTIAHELSNDTFAQKSSFKNLLKELIKDQNKLFEANCELVIDKRIKWEKKDDAVKMNLYRIIQEALNNCNKYAKAKNITISFSKDINEEKIFLSIKDDGIGFKVNKGKNGIGMKNMKERAIAIKGEFKVYSEINKGTIINISFSFKN